MAVESEALTFWPGAPLLAHFAMSGIPPRTAGPRQPFLLMRVFRPKLCLGWGP
jgi:hypothetical protein